MTKLPYEVWWTCSVGIRPEEHVVAAFQDRLDADTWAALCDQRRNGNEIRNGVQHFVREAGAPPTEQSGPTFDNWLARALAALVTLAEKGGARSRPGVSIEAWYELWRTGCAAEDAAQRRWNEEIARSWE